MRFQGASRAAFRVEVEGQVCEPHAVGLRRHQQRERMALDHRVLGGEIAFTKWLGVYIGVPAVRAAQTIPYAARIPDQSQSKQALACPEAHWNVAAWTYAFPGG